MWLTGCTLSLEKLVTWGCIPFSCWLHSLASVTFGWLLSRFSFPYETGDLCERLPSSIQPQSATRQPSKEQKPDRAMLFFFSLLSKPAVQLLWWNAVICSTGFDMWQPQQAACKQAQFPHRPVCPCWSMPEQVSYLRLMDEIPGFNYSPAKDLEFTSPLKSGVGGAGSRRRCNRRCGEGYKSHHEQSIWDTGFWLKMCDMYIVRKKHTLHNYILTQLVDEHIWSTQPCCTYSSLHYCW